MRNRLPIRWSGRWVSAAVLVPGLVLATACAGPAVSSAPAAAQPAVRASTAADGSQGITLRVGDGLRFEPAAIVVEAGQPVHLTLQNTGGGEHDFVLSEGVSPPVRIAASAGQTATGTFTIDQPGTYGFVCSVPGHAMAGMRGTLTVQ